MCKYSDITGYKCPHENLEDNDYCIFHLQNDNKDVDEFNKGIDELLETEEDSIHLNGFYFPPGTSDFTKKNFQTEIHFFNVTFSGKADFKGAKFSGKADFEGAKFSGNAIFYNVEFSEADFRHAKFSGKANFRYATFSVNASFWFATFSEASFLYAKFSGKASFRDAKFSENAYFTYATFSEMDFMFAKFSGNVYFKDATFSEEADFEGAKFSGNVYFEDATFSEEAIFSNAELTGKFAFIPNKSETIILENTYFSDNVRIKADLSRCSFANSNIERVDMTDSLWMRDDKPKNSLSAYKKRFKEKIGLSKPSIIIWEEYQGKFSSDWKELEGIYRRLKQSYQKYGDSETAGKFYYQEMECKREQLKRIEKLWYILFKKLCGYGERPFNVIGYSGLIILASSLLFFYWGIELLGSEVLNFPPRVIDYNPSLNIQWAIINIDKVIIDWLECLYTSVITFTTLGYGDVHPIGYSRIVASVEAGFGIIMTALFIFVFTRKMLR